MANYLSLEFARSGPMLLAEARGKGRWATAERVLKTRA